MKVITITEKNIKSVYGRIRKFFFNNNRTGFEEWHNFDCGFKKHISPLIYISNKRIRNVSVYPSPIFIKYKKAGTVPGIDYDYILLKLDVNHSLAINIGDKISFCGNRIIYRSEFLVGEHKYIYSVFQALSMTQNEQRELRKKAAMEKNFYEILMND